MGATYTFDVERELAFPVHPFITDANPPQSEQGRLVMMGPEGDQLAQGEWLGLLGENAIANLGPQDVVWIPLYACHVHRVSDWPAPKLADYDRHIDLIKELAPRVGAILVGNMGPEMCWWAKSVTEPLLGLRARMGAEFIRHHNDLITGFGGRPAYGSVDWDLLCDCYEERLLQAAIKEANALQVCFCGFTMVRECKVDRTQYLFQRQLSWLGRHDDFPPGRLMEYLNETEVWSGVNLVPGLQAENDTHLAAYGFAAGICGGATCHMPE